MFASIVQCAIATVIGCALFTQTVGEYPTTRLLISLVGGVGGNWLLMRLYVLARYGRGAKMSMEP